MRYFKDPKGQVYGYDESIEFFEPLIQQAIDSKWEEIIGDPTPPLTNEQIISNYNKATTKMLNDFAVTWKYDSMLDAVSYSNSSNPQYKAESLALMAWRDEVWTEAEKIQSGKPPDMVERFLALLPPAPSKPSAEKE